MQHILNACNAHRGWVLSNCSSVRISPGHAKKRTRNANWTRPPVIVVLLWLYDALPRSFGRQRPSPFDTDEFKFVSYHLDLAMTSNLQVSLPKHLHDSLEPLPDLLPTELRALVVQALEPPAKEIHYELLVKVSTWAQSEDGKDRLKAADLRQYSSSLV